MPKLQRACVLRSGAQGLRLPLNELLITAAAQRSNFYADRAVALKVIFRGFTIQDLILTTQGLKGLFNHNLP
jgi:hypothetical protein